MSDKFLDVDAQLVESCGELAIVRKQEIPDEFLDHLADQRFDSLHTPAGEMHRVASIPVAVVEHWLRQGFNVFEEPITAITARLHKEGLDAFMATRKRL